MTTQRRKELGFKVPMKLRIAKWALGSFLFAAAIIVMNIVCINDATAALNYQNAHAFVPVHLTHTN